MQFCSETTKPSRREIRLDQRRRPFGVVGLHRDERDVDRLLLGQLLHLGEMHGLRLRDGEFLFGRDAVELEPARADRLDVLGPHVDQGHVVAVMGEMPPT